jgi:predicted acylesterase/phospholipase RssA
MRALRRSQLVELDRAWMIELLSDRPDAAMAVVQAVVERAGRPAVPSATVVAIVPLESTVVDEARLIGETAAAAVAHPLVEAADVPGGFAGTTDGSDWLDDMEQNHGGVVLLGDPTDSVWTIAAAEVADRVVFVVDVEHGPEIGQLEHQILRLIPREANATRLLLLVHPANADRPSGTRAWLDRRELDRHLHLRRKTPSDTHRVARYVIGQPLTMAIGAGGVRSAGAVGTLRALEQRGVAVDAVAGVSGGAIIASWITTSASIDELEDKTEWSMRRLLDFTLPVGSVVAGKRAWGRIQEAAGDRDIADTWLPLSIVTTDLTSGEPVNHTRGPMADALYASISIPGVFPPVDIDGHLHVDGAVFDSVPVAAGRELVPEGQMVVVDLAQPHGRSTEPLPRVMSGPRLLLRRLIPGVRSASVPHPLDTLMRSTTVASARRRVDALDAIDCHVHLNLSEFSVLDFDKVRRVIALGEAQSGEPLDDYVASDHPPIIDPLLLSSNSPAVSDAPHFHQEETDRLALASIGGSLSLAWSDLRFRARRFAVAGFASSVVLALLLQMTGVVNQLYREPEVTVDAFGGSYWVVPVDADGAFTSNATFVDGVGNASSGGVLLARYRVAETDGKGDLDVILVGHEDLPGGAPSLDDGRPAESADEVVLSKEAGFAVGDRLLLGSHEAVVTGVVSDATVFAGMPLAFVPLDVARDLIVDGEPLLSALVVDAVPELPPSLHALDSATVAEDALGPIERPITTLRLVQVLLAVVATLIIGAVVFLATLDRLRDIAVLRAVGVRSGIISLGVAVQALGVGLVAGMAALVIQALIAPVFPLSVHLDVLDRAVLVIVAMVVATGASYGAIRRTLRIDPAQAFTGPGA